MRLKGVIFENINIKIVNTKDKSENFVKLTLSDIYIVDGKVLNVIKNEVKKLFSKLIFSNVNRNE